MENDNILKVLHDCRNESATLWFQHNIMMSNVFDTQVRGKRIVATAAFCAN